MKLKTERAKKRYRHEVLSPKIEEWTDLDPPDTRQWFCECCKDQGCSCCR